MFLDILIVDHTEKHLKIHFNNVVLNSNKSLEMKRMIKALINNYKFNRCKEIILNGNYDEIKNAYENIGKTTENVFLYLSIPYNISIFVPILIPILIDSYKILKM